MSYVSKVSKKKERRKQYWKKNLEEIISEHTKLKQFSRET